MFSALTDLLKSKNTIELLKTLVLQNDKGEYLLFGTYIIKKLNDEYNVAVGTSSNKTFSNLKTAVTWATMDHRNMIMEANTVDHLDRTLSGAEFTIELYKKMYKKAKNSEMKIIYLNKLQQGIIKKKKLSDELEGYIRRTQEWQRSRFAKQTTK